MRASVSGHPASFNHFPCGEVVATSGLACGLIRKPTSEAACGYDRIARPGSPRLCGDRARSLLLVQTLLPAVEEVADLAVGEVEVGQLGAVVDRPLPLARLGAARRQLPVQLLADLRLVRRQVLQRLLEVAAGQLPVVARLEA